MRRIQRWGNLVLNIQIRGVERNGLPYDGIELKVLQESAPVFRDELKEDLKVVRLLFELKRDVFSPSEE